MTIKSHRDLLVWQRAVDLATRVYSACAGFPRHELYGLTAQTTRSAVSVPANIAEGHARFSGRDYSRFLAIAKGSLMELETHLVIAQRLGYLAQRDYDDLLQQVDQLARMLSTLRRRVDARTASDPSPP